MSELAVSRWGERGVVLSRCVAWLGMVRRINPKEEIVVDGRPVLGDRPVLKQQAMPVPAGIVPVYTMGMAREGTCRLEQMLPKREVATVPVR